jgi:hypothetical protein
MDPLRYRIPVSPLARFCASAGSSQWAVLHHFMEYIEGLPSFQITYCTCAGSRRDLLSGYADSDWGNSSSRRSTSGNLMLYNKSPIIWRSKLQKTTALSMAKAEYYLASAARVNVLFLRNLCFDSISIGIFLPTTGCTLHDIWLCTLHP